MSTESEPIFKSTEDLAKVFAQMGPLWVRWVHGHLKDSPLSYARLKLLSALEVVGPQIMSDLSAQLGVTPRNITALVDALEAEGLVKRQPHPTDRRATVIELTSQGEFTCAGTLQELDHAAVALFGQLSETDQRALQKLLLQVTELLRADLAPQSLLAGGQLRQAS